MYSLNVECTIEVSRGPRAVKCCRRCHAIDCEESGGEAREVGGDSGGVRGEARSGQCDKESEGIGREESG